MQLPMPQYWLYDQLKQEKPDWEPMRAMQSSINWIHALAYEVVQEHGQTSSAQLQSCLSHFDATIKSRNTPPPLGPIFGTLFHSLNYCLSLASLHEREATAPWVFPSAIVIHYYAIYNATLSMLAALENFRGEKHAKAIASYNNLCDKLPHPLNMTATRVRGEEYRVLLPNYAHAAKYDLTKSFIEDRGVAQGMVCSYLSGTADWRVKQVKEQIILDSKGKINDFRTKANRDVRDSRLPGQINYLNCAYRYRGKANYRDSMFLSYGREHSWLNSQYISSLYVIAAFNFTCGLAFAEKRIGKKYVTAFVTDLSAHLRGRDAGKGLEQLWDHLASHYASSK